MALNRQAIDFNRTIDLLIDLLEAGTKSSDKKISLTSMNVKAQFQNYVKDIAANKVPNNLDYLVSKIEMLKVANFFVEINNAYLQELITDIKQGGVLIKKYYVDHNDNIDNSQSSVASETSCMNARANEIEHQALRGLYQEKYTKAKAALQSGDFALAIEEFEATLQLLRRMSEKTPDETVLENYEIPRHITSLSYKIAYRYQLLLNDCEDDEAEEETQFAINYYLKTVQHYKQYFPDYPATPVYSLLALTDLYLLDDKLTDACSAFEKALTILKDNIANSNNKEELLAQLFISFKNLYEFLEVEDIASQPKSVFVRAIIFLNYIKTHCNIADFEQTNVTMINKLIYKTYVMLGNIYQNEGNKKEALKYYTEAFNHAQQVKSIKPKQLLATQINLARLFKPNNQQDGEIQEEIKNLQTNINKLLKDNSGTTLQKN